VLDVPLRRQFDSHGVRIIDRCQSAALASAMELWVWTLEHLLEAEDADGRTLFRDQRQGVTFPMADALCWLLASRFQILALFATVSRHSFTRSVSKRTV